MEDCVLFFFVSEQNFLNNAKRQFINMSSHVMQFSMYRSSVAISLFLSLKASLINVVFVLKVVGCEKSDPG